jgi:LysR family glycine cleavage system transcriptional activator
VDVTRLPPFFALRALEAAARHRSYTGAARELAVTHGAISQQIRKLEAELGARLFERERNGMTPTSDAERLAREVSRATGILQNALRAFAQTAEHDPLVVSIDTKIATRWLAPRLRRLLAHPAGANLEFRVEERIANFVTDGADVGIRYGGGIWEGLESVSLFQEFLFPVCSPQFAAMHHLQRPEDVARSPLVQHRRYPWKLWFEAFGVPTAAISGPVLDDSLMVLEAAAQGLGLALARSGLVEPDLASGRLVRPLEAPVATERGSFVVWRSDSRKLRRISLLRDWLICEAGDQACTGGSPGRACS